MVLAKDIHFAESWVRSTCEDHQWHFDSMDFKNGELIFYRMHRIWSGSDLAIYMPYKIFGINLKLK